MLQIQEKIHKKRSTTIINGEMTTRRAFAEKNTQNSDISAP
jgi:hypothetical protein